MNDKDPEKTKAVYPGGLSSESSKEGVLSVEPFSILTSRTLSLMGNSLVITKLYKMSQMNYTSKLEWSMAKENYYKVAKSEKSWYCKKINFLDKLI